MVAVRPEGPAAVSLGIDLGLSGLLGALAEPDEPADPEAMRRAQARYTSGQRQNQHTRRMLAGCVGQTLADLFINQVLFPEP
jgi:hypothetical protein